MMIQGPNNVAWSSEGPMDENHDLVPVHLDIVSTSSNRTLNEPLPLVGFNYEENLPSAEIDDCIENFPDYWMSITFDVTAYKLRVGETYHMYQYVIDLHNLTGMEPLPVPTSRFNALATIAPHVFVAKGEEYVTSLTTTSDKAVLIRCVLASAP